MPDAVDPDQLVTTAEIAERLGLAHSETVHSWRTRHPDFPAPVVDRGRVLLWLWPDVETWARATGRLR
jgi:hypothetical protein